MRSQSSRFVDEIDAIDSLTLTRARGLYHEVGRGSGLRPWTTRSLGSRGNSSATSSKEWAGPDGAGGGEEGLGYSVSGCVFRPERGGGLAGAEWAANHGFSAHLSDYEREQRNSPRKAARLLDIAGTWVEERTARYGRKVPRRESIP